jgi:hypothetical protein
VPERVGGGDQDRDLGRSRETDIRAAWDRVRRKAAAETMADPDKAEEWEAEFGEAYRRRRDDRSNG